MNKIIDFFKFLEEKKGTKTPIELKLLHQDKFKLTKEDLTINSDLNFNFETIISLPDNLRINGDLYLRYTKITSLPDNLTVTNSLYIDNSTLRSLPNNLKIGDFIMMKNTDIINLPGDLIVKGFIYVDDNKSEYFKNKYPQYKFTC